MLDRRQDHKTAEQISEAMRMKRAFGEDAGIELLKRQAVPEQLARAALGGKYERRKSA